MKLLDILKGFISNSEQHYDHLKDMRTMRYQKKVRHEDIFNYVHQSKQLAFVLSTGRCGTMLLTRILENCGGCQVVHEPSNELLYWGKHAYLNKDRAENKALFDGARYEDIRNALLANKKYVETNNRITFFANEIAELYPKAKFIHLVRDPKKFIRSGLSRGWYKDDFHYINEGVIEPRDKAAWNTWNRAQKIGWLWNETNQFIEDFKATQNNDKCLTITSEELFGTSSAIESILKFLDLPPMEIKTIGRFQKKKVNKGRKKATSANQDQNSLDEIVSNLSLGKKYG